MTRIKASFVHLGISLIVFVFLASLVLFVWYPDFFFETDGGWQGMRIIVLVDLVLGPMLTLIVYKHGKPGLKFDLAAIGVFQAICLAGGTFVVYDERPLALVYVDGQFYSLSADAFKEVGAQVPTLANLPGDMPKRVQIRLPEDFTEQSEIRRKALSSKQPLRTFASLYSAFDTSAIDLEKDAYPYDALKKRDVDTQEIPRWLVDHGGELTDYAFFPFGTRYEYVFLGVDKKAGRLTGILKTPGPVSISRS